MRLPQRSLRSEDGGTAEAALSLGQGSGRLAGRGLAGAFPQGGSGPRLCGAGVCGGAGGRCRKADGMGRVREERRGADTASSGMPYAYALAEHYAVIVCL